MLGLVVVGVVGLALVTIIGMVEFCLLIWYLKSKPPGNQTLLDRLFIDTYAWMVAVLGNTVIISAVELTGCVMPEMIVVTLSQISRFCQFSVMMWMSLLGVVNGIMVYFPAVMDQVSENKFMNGVRLSLLALATVLTAIAYWINPYPLSYIRMTQKFDLALASTINVQVILVVIMMLVFLALKLSLVITKKILSEGESNMLPLDFMLVAAFVLFLMVTLRKYIISGEFQIRFVVGLIFYFTYPSLIIWRKSDIQIFIARKLADICFFDPMVWVTPRRASVHPEIELNV